MSADAARPHFSAMPWQCKASASGQAELQRRVQLQRQEIHNGALGWHSALDLLIIIYSACWRPRAKENKREWPAATAHATQRYLREPQCEQTLIRLQYHARCHFPSFCFNRQFDSCIASAAARARASRAA